MDRNFENTSAMRVIFFFENVQSFSEISNMKKKTEKKFFLLEIIASQLATLDRLY